MTDNFEFAEIPLRERVRGVLIQQPEWTRLEPQLATGDPTPGLAARFHDPLWALARQWQFGEFHGEDAGSPVAVHVQTSARPVTAWSPGSPGANRPARPLQPDDVLDPCVEAESSQDAGPSLRARAEAGSALLAALAETGLDARALLLATCPLDGAVSPEARAAVPRRFAVLRRSCPDAEEAARSLERGSDPSWLVGAPDLAREAARTWLAWYRSAVSSTRTNEAWIPERLEYRFSIRVGAANNQQVLAAHSHEGGELSWYSFDAAPRNARLNLSEESAPVAPVSPGAPGRTMLPAPLRYSGMPADRLWEFEDGSINFGQLEVQPHDLARLCLVEFATVYGNDWFVVPVDCDAGHLVDVVRVQYTTTFGEKIDVVRAPEQLNSGRFRMFCLGDAETGATLPGLFLPPTARGTVEGPALEEVVFFRDETANMAWAVEKTVQNAVGEPHARASEPWVEPPAATALPGAELTYKLQSAVPPHWIPLVPVPSPQMKGFVLRKGTMTGEDAARGVLLRPRPFDLQDEEVPREGVRVRRVPSTARSCGGRRLRWIARRVDVVGGEGMSGLAFDEAKLVPGSARPRSEPPAPAKPELVREKIPEPSIARGDRAHAGELMGISQPLRSADGRFTFVFQTDGNLVLYKGNVPRWASNTAGQPADRCVMQTDGNLVIYHRDGRALWSSNTHGHPGSHFIIQDDGNAVIYSDTRPLWATNTPEPERTRGR